MNPSDESIFVTDATTAHPSTEGPKAFLPSNLGHHARNADTNVPGVRGRIQRAGDPAEGGKRGAVAISPGRLPQERAEDLTAVVAPEPGRGTPGVPSLGNTVGQGVGDGDQLQHAASSALANGVGMIRLSAAWAGRRAWVRCGP